MNFAFGNAKAAFGRFKIRPARREKKLVLDISNQCQGWDDSGLLGIAFHPGFATNHFMFVYYTWVKPGTVAGSPTTRPVPNLPDTYHDRLERYTLDANGVAIPGSVKIFVDLTNQTVWHHGGGMFFHPVNGFLYWTDGDNSVGDNDQIIDKSLYSGVFRIDVDCRGGNVSHAPPRQPTGGFTANYFIPERQSVRRPVECAGGVFLPRPAQPASHDLRSAQRKNFYRRRRRKLARGN